MRVWTQPEGQPEVKVRGTRRRRAEPPPPVSPPVPNVRTWLIYAGLTTGLAMLMLDGYLEHQPQGAVLPSLAQVIEVKSLVSQAADSLEVIVLWDLTLSNPEGWPDSIQVKVKTDQPTDSVVALQPADQLADTAYVPAPPPGETARGISCAAAAHPGKPLAETCTPWQFVRPTASAAAGALPQRIVIQPTGLQVDPDVGGRCARWQRTHPHRSVWAEVNRTAVPECTGPNGKPTVAQFCAFAVLADGRRVKTANSAGNRYCDELFEEWSRERYS